MTSSLTGKTAVVTGGAKGIGAAVVRRFTADGANVVIADIDGVNGRELAEACGRALFVPCDVSQEEQVLAVLDAAESQFGPVDILVNDAAWQLNKPLLETTTEEFERVMGINVVGSFLFLREVLRFAVIDTAFSDNTFPCRPVFIRYNRSIRKY